MSEKPIILPLQEIENIIERAAEKGAKKALADIGLADENAAHDIHDLRSLLTAINSAKRTAWQTIIRVLTMSLIMALMAGAAIKLKIFGGGDG